MYVMARSTRYHIAWDDLTSVRISLSLFVCECVLFCEYANENKNEYLTDSDNMNTTKHNNSCEYSINSAGYLEHSRAFWHTMFGAFF